nr:efflux RND transporter periplasmic adaptor subunit [Paraburkholderia sp. BL8N3]
MPILLLALAAAACGPSKGSGGDAVASSAAALSVTLVTAEPRRWAATIHASGSIAPFATIDVAAPTNGAPLASVKAHVGDLVRAGQVLATLNVESVRLRRTEALAEVAEALANLEQANAQLAGAMLLDTSGAISRQALVAAQTGARVSAARLSGARARLALIDLESRASTLRAPASGIVASSQATPGSVPAAGSAVFTLIPGGRLEWRAELGMRALASVREQQAATLVAPDGGRIVGTVRRVSPLLDPATLTGIVYVDLPASSRLAIGSVVSGTITGSAIEVPTLPASAIVTRDGFDYAWTVDGKQRVHAVKLTTGQRRDGRVEVTGGLPAAARVVERGVGLLDEGDVVALQQAPGTARAGE